MAEKKSTEKIEREYTIPLREGSRPVPRYKKTPKAVKTIKEFLVRHMKIRDRDLKKIKIDMDLNEVLWKRGIKKHPHKIKVKVVKEGDIVRVYAIDVPDKQKFRKIREDKKYKEREEEREKRKSMMQKAKESIQGKGKEKKEVKEIKEDKDNDGIEDKKEEIEKKESQEEKSQKEEKEEKKTIKKTTKVKSGKEKLAEKKGQDKQSRGK